MQGSVWTASAAKAVLSNQHFSC